MSRQAPNMTPNQNPPIEFRIWLGNRQSVFDVRADAYVMNANRLGLSVPQITLDLCRNGYAASTAEVEKRLGRQGVQTMTRAPATEVVFALLRWDARAEAFTLAAHRIGQTTVQILAGLTRAGYGATVEEVQASLDRQRVYRA